jgi:hypothetical protein
MRAARELGLQTAFAPRPSEFGPDQSSDLCAEESWDIVARDFVSLTLVVKITHLNPPAIPEREGLIRRKLLTHSGVTVAVTWLGTDVRMNQPAP